jgi:hypothetical protein
VLSQQSELSLFQIFVLQLPGIATEKVMPMLQASGNKSGSHIDHFTCDESWANHPTQINTCMCNTNRCAQASAAFNFPENVLSYFISQTCNFTSAIENNYKLHREKYLYILAIGLKILCLQIFWRLHKTISTTYL